ncbi:proteasome adapter and scaffold protein ECM29 [Populus alba x Populus x berolinensis]|uniref:Proteasome adapter and scaffold protein ECM29 n=1 Tax=Populus alba x Populus x berolinensis TaxID=444605 RepID=A0AAD6RQ94_9ROSI|nr:proteasome adapter and scaffold protein ECM29 [Populus alba x Populus x berolinensis]
MAESSSSSSSPVVKSDAETEELLDRMLTRLALCDDSKLETLLSKILPLTISSLSSNSTAVRNKAKTLNLSSLAFNFSLYFFFGDSGFGIKCFRFLKFVMCVWCFFLFLRATFSTRALLLKVLEILSHVNKRVKYQHEIGLPLQELWKLYTEANATAIVKNFCIVYIEMAFERVNIKEKENMAPVLVANISKLPLQHQEIILRIVVRVIGECHASGIDEEVAVKYRSVNGSQDRELFAEFCLHLMLYKQSSQGGGCSPGLSIAQSNRVAGKNPLKNEELLMRKLGVLNVVDAMELGPEPVYPLYLVASADSQEAVIKKGEELLRKKAASANLDDSNLINKLFLLFNGTTSTGNVAPESKVNPASVSLKTKLMSVFCRSITAANSFPATLQCIFGCIYGSGTTSRLKQLGMEFTVWVFKHAKSDQLKLMGPVILTGILKLLDSYSSSDSDAIARDTKTFSFQAIGLLGQRLPHLFRDKIDMAVRLFDALKTESETLRFVIQEATSSLAAAYNGAPAAVLMDLETLLLNNFQAEQNEVRLCAVRWATSLFDLKHCPSRFICMLGVADSRLDIREMALEGLFLDKDTGRSRIQNIDFKYPKLGEMLDYIVKQQPKLLESSEMREQRLLFSSKMYVAMIKFLLKCFESELDQNNSLGRSTEFLSSVETMCLLLEHAMAYEGSVELHATASKALITIGSYLPEMIASHYVPRISWLKQLLSHVDLDTRESAARLLGIACSAIPPATSSDLISELLAAICKTNNLRFESLHGMLCAIGYATAECMSKAVAIPGTLFQKILKCLADVANSETATLASIAMQALGHIGLRAPLPPLVDDSSSVDVLILLNEKLSKLLSGDDNKAIQKIVISLGHICVKETSPSLLNIALDLIFSLCRSKVEDVLFAAGEALSFLWGGIPVTADVILKTNYSSLSMTSNFLLGDISLSLSKYNPNEKCEANEDYHATIRDSITRKLFETLLYSSRKEERCAGTVWLLSLTMYCGRHPTIQQMLPQIQEAFSHLLGEQNELTQELASQGMSIVYDLGDAAMKKTLVDALVTTLTGSGKRKRAIKDAMAHIWKSLVADPKRTIDQHLDLIVDDLIIQCGSRLWRSREASCLALADIIQGRKFEQVGKHLKKIWTAAFRAMDDIKETVRNAGDRLCRAISSLTIRLCDISLTEVSDAREAMGIVLPLLLADGILSKVDSIRKASIGVVMKLAKGAGIALRPHLSDLVCCMLESLSSLEDQGLNYVELHAENVGIQSEKLENLRISIAKSSPMWETLDLCINVINTESLNLLVPRLAHLVRSGVGLNTRVGVASFISLLIPKVGADVKPFTSILLRVLFPVVKEEKSAAAKRAFASACAMVLKHAGHSQAQKLIEDTAALHTGEKNAQISCAILLKSYYSVASDVLSGYHAVIFPVIFISRFEDDKNISGLFEELWEDSTSGERVTIQLYLGEIVSLICEGLASSSWTSKRKSAQAICKLSEVMGESLSSYHHVLLDSVMKELPGRLWEGKESLLYAIGALSSSCHKAISSENPVTSDAILNMVSSACTKKVKKYREAAFSSLDQVIKAFGDPKFFNVIFPLLFGMCDSTAANKSGSAHLASDAAKTDNVDPAVPLEKILGCVMSCIHVAHLNDIFEQKKNLMDLLLISLSPGFQWTVKLSAFSLIKELCSRLQSILVEASKGASQHDSTTSFVQELFYSVSPKIVECISTIKIAQVHISASECLLEVTGLASVRWTDVGFKEELLHQYEVEKNEEAKSYLKKCIDIFENLE